MAAVILHRTDPARNLRRLPDLFGEWSFVREWGRIGGPGKVRIDPYPPPQEAQAALDRQCRAKERKGYGRLRAGGITDGT
jgi:predicted DNA-binding WGR domain protein